MPLDAGVGGEHRVGVCLIGERVEELGRRGAFPEKFVHLARATVAKQQAAGAEVDASRLGQRTHPYTVLRVSMAKSVLVTDLSKMVVARVGIAALAVVELVADRVVIVALDADDVVLAQEFEASIRPGAKATEVAQAVHGVDAPLARVVDGGGQGEVIAVNAAEAGDALRGGHGEYCTRIGGAVSVGWLTFKTANTL